MTFGVQNSYPEAAAQLDYAVKTRGINFIDTAEMYPVPMSDPRWVAGTTEEYIGRWLADNKELRPHLVIATKIVGYTGAPKSSPAGPAAAKGILARRDDPPVESSASCRLDRASIIKACNASLRRLRTDYIDLYQLHWPDRWVPGFGVSAYEPSKERADDVPIDETLLALKELLDAGKIRAYGLSNETTFGVCQAVLAADRLGMPRPVSIQNSFSLVHRAFETELAEACAPSHFNIGLLPWSVLAGGVLTGKYRHGAAPGGARFAEFPSGFQERFHGERVVAAVEEYAEVAEEAGVSLTKLAVAFCASRWFVDGHGSCIVGATSVEQLAECIDGYKVKLSEEVLKKIDAVHLKCRDPTQGK